MLWLTVALVILSMPAEQLSARVQQPYVQDEERTARDYANNARAIRADIELRQELLEMYRTVGSAVLGVSGALAIVADASADEDTLLLQVADSSAHVLKATLVGRAITGDRECLTIDRQERGLFAVSYCGPEEDALLGVLARWALAKPCPTNPLQLDIGKLPRRERLMWSWLFELEDRALGNGCAKRRGTCQRF